MKIITSIDEWLEAAENRRLMYLSSISGWVGSAYSGNATLKVTVGSIARNLKEKRYAIAPEEVKLMEYFYGGESYYIPADREPPVLWKATYRTFTGVISDE